MDPALIDQIQSGDRRALSRAITEVENASTLGDVAKVRGVIGITGPPGVGKSTLVSELISLFRSRGESVGVLAVDPTSPLTGGAILGDRIRMQNHVDDDGVFVRSMATRGHLGGLAPTTAHVVSLMGQAGFDRLIVETVGVGQSEVEVMHLAEVVVLVVGPSWGDQIQADKAGIVEIADIFVVNKADRPGVDEVRRALREPADLSNAKIIATTATTGEGVPELAEEVDRLLG